MAAVTVVVIAVDIVVDMVKVVRRTTATTTKFVKAACMYVFTQKYWHATRSNTKVKSIRRRF